MNFSWFSSAYDTDDVPYRIAVLVQMAGVLVVAIGIPRALDRRDFAIVLAGYLIVRMAMVGLWLRAAVSNPSGRQTALRYAVGITVVEAGWVAWFFFVPLGVAVWFSCCWRQPVVGPDRCGGGREALGIPGISPNAMALSQLSYSARPSRPGRSE